MTKQKIYHLITTPIVENYSAEVYEEVSKRLNKDGTISLRLCPRGHIRIEQSTGATSITYTAGPWKGPVPMHRGGEE